MQSIQQLTYRSFTETDLPGILSLWENYSGWGSITMQQFNDWYINTPYGNCPTVIAEDDSGKIVGQLSLTPATILFSGKKVTALRLSAPVLHQDFRLHDLRSGDHPVFLMIKHGMSMAKEMGYSIVYSLPAHGWLGLLKMFPRLGFPDIQIASYKCVSIPLPGNSILQHPTPADWDTSLIETFDPSFDQLWKEASESFPINCGIIRSSDWLNWKMDYRHHIIFKITIRDYLAGYAVYRRKDGLLLDILARNSADLKDVLLCSIKALHIYDKENANFGLKEIKFMCSPQLLPILKDLTTQPVNFEFAFSCYPLTNMSSKKNILPENWYVMPLD